MRIRSVPEVTLIVAESDESSFDTGKVRRGSIFSAEQEEVERKATLLVLAFVDSFLLTQKFALLSLLGPRHMRRAVLYLKKKVSEIADERRREATDDPRRRRILCPALNDLAVGCRLLGMGLAAVNALVLLAVGFTFGELPGEGGVGAKDVVPAVVICDARSWVSRAERRGGRRIALVIVASMVQIDVALTERLRSASATACSLPKPNEETCQGCRECSARRGRTDNRLCP